MFVRVRTRCSYEFARCSYAVRTLFVRVRVVVRTLFVRARTHPRTTRRARLRPFHGPMHCPDADALWCVRCDAGNMALSPRGAICSELAAELIRLRSHAPAGPRENAVICIITPRRPSLFRTTRACRRPLGPENSAPLLLAWLNQKCHHVASPRRIIRCAAVPSRRRPYGSIAWL